MRHEWCANDCGGARTLVLRYNLTITKLIPYVMLLHFWNVVVGHTRLSQAPLGLHIPLLPKAAVCTNKGALERINESAYSFAISCNRIIN